jgi:hypothetical protein
MVRMLTAARTGHAQDPAGLPAGLVAVPAGAALLVGEPGSALGSWHAAAAGLPADHGRTVVAVAVPGPLPKASWPALAALLHGRGPLRLVLPRAAAGRRCLARALADRLRVEVVAPAGDLVLAGCGTLLAGAAPGGRAGWLRLRPGRRPHPAGRRYPAPPWEQAADIRPAGLEAAVEHLPAGLWLRPAALPAGARSAPWAAALTGTPCRPDVISVAVGAPGGRPVPVQDICRALAALPAAALAAVRLVELGPVSGLDGRALGQAVADRLAAPVRVRPGLVPPGGHEPCHVDAAGRFSWRPFGTEIAYRPSSGAGAGIAWPLIGRCRQPLPGAPEVGPATFGWNDHIVAEVVQSGLWIRPAGEPAGMTVERANPGDPQHAWILIGSAGAPVPAHLRAAALDLVGRLDEHTRRAARLAFATVSRGAPAAGAGPQPARETGAAQPGRAAHPPAPAAVPAPWRVPVQTEDAAPPAGRSAPPRPPAASSGDTAAPRVDRALPAGRPAAPTVGPGRLAGSGSGPAAGEGSVPDGTRIPAPAPAGPAPGWTGPAAPAGTAVPVPPGPAAAGRPAATASGGQAPPRPTPPGQPPGRPVAPLAGPFDPRQLTAAYRSSPQERAWLRGTLGEHQERFAAIVRRTVVQHPGLAMPAEDPEAAVTDLVAVHVYLTATGNALDRRFESGDLGHLRAYGGCLVSGLVRLPAYRGAAGCHALRAAAFDGDLEPSGTVTCRTPIVATAAPTGGQGAVLLWSLTARHVDRLDPGCAGGTRRVLFLPNTAFRVLDRTGSGEERRIFLREITPPGRGTGRPDAEILAALRAGAGGPAGRPVPAAAEGARA